MDQKTREAIAAKLNEKGKATACPRCSTSSFFVLDGYFNPTLQDEPQGIVLGGRSVPCAVVACAHCGHLSFHALGALGLLPPESSEKEKGDVAK
jgi:hypothetical protein